AARKAGLEHIAPHDLRRTCAKLCQREQRRLAPRPAANRLQPFPLQKLSEISLRSAGIRRLMPRSRLAVAVAPISTASNGMRRSQRSMLTDKLLTVSTNRRVSTRSPLISTNTAGIVGFPFFWLAALGISITCASAGGLSWSGGV